MDYSAVLWDFGGVITTSPFEAFNRFEAARGLPLDFIRSINARNHETNAWAQFESNRVTVAQFDELFAKETAAAGFELRGREVLGLLGGEIRPHIVAVLKRCKRDFKVACLTNNGNVGKGSGMSVSDVLAAEVSKVMGIFDLVVESSKEGIRKPNPRIYELACERLEVDPKEVVYLDDLGINLKPARAMGMTTIKVGCERDVIQGLRRLLGINFDELDDNRALGVDDED